MRRSVGFRSLRMCQQGQGVSTVAFDDLHESSSAFSSVFVAVEFFRFGTFDTVFGPKTCIIAITPLTFTP